MLFYFLLKSKNLMNKKFLRSYYRINLIYTSRTLFQHQVNNIIVKNNLILKLKNSKIKEHTKNILFQNLNKSNLFNILYSKNFLKNL